MGVQPSKPKNRKNIKAVVISKNNPSRLNNFSDVTMGRIIAVPPKIKPTLNILEPTTLPIDISDCPDIGYCKKYNFLCILL